MPLVRDVNDRGLQSGSRLLFFQIRLQILFPAANHSHETDAVALGDRAGPAFEFDESPIRKIVDLAFLVRLGRKHEELHPFFFYPNLSDAMNFIVVEDAGAER